MKVIKNLQFALCIVVLCFVCAACDSTTAEEYKAQAIGYAESGEHQKAAESYLKAAEKGDAEAQYFVGMLYLTGKDYLNNPLTEDKELAVKWLVASAKQDYKDALFIVGQLCLDGTIEKDNFNQALKYWNKAADLGNVMALYQIGNAYDYGQGVEIDKHKASQFYSKAYSKGVLMAGICLASIQMNDTENYNYMQSLQFCQEVYSKIEQLGIDRFDIPNIMKHDLSVSIKEIKI